MSSTAFVKTGNERRYMSKGDVAPEDTTPPNGTRPLSLTAGPTLSWLNLIGNEEAQQITEEWRPRFTIRQATTAESIEWL